eukprot:4393187-Pyramimonas_sp.AAC.1
MQGPGKAMSTRRHCASGAQPAKREGCKAARVTLERSSSLLCWLTVRGGGWGGGRNTYTNQPLRCTDKGDPHVLAETLPIGPPTQQPIHYKSIAALTLRRHVTQKKPRRMNVYGYRYHVFRMSLVGRRGFVGPRRHGHG